MSEFTNALIHEKSPYLLQHAHNPVEWHAWNDETLAKAEKESKMLLVSIGYSTCHWCHVMEHESFSNAEVAAYMNENFLCIKVDREERPDIDQYFMDAVQLLGMQGGWPLNCFALPDKRVVYGGTYFPKNQWMGVLQQLSALYKSNPTKLQLQASEIASAMEKSEERMLNLENTNDGIDILSFFEKLKTDLDFEYGGSIGAPKFPMPVNLNMLQDLYYYTKNEEILNYLNLTLQKMAAGGIYDQLGGGFARYSTDVEWKVPHFEKMLYDNAQLISIYARQFRITGEKEFLNIALHSFEFLQREMKHPEVGWYSAIDADSSGEEGTFYIWKEAEFDEVLDKNSALMKDFYGISGAGFWENEKNILLRAHDLDDFLKKHGLNENEFLRIKSKADQQLFDYRAKREYPHVDTKRLLSWNSLMLSALIDLYKATQDDQYLNLAEKELQKLMTEFAPNFPKLKHSDTRDEHFIEDYAFLATVLTDLFAHSGKAEYYNEAEELLKFIMQEFGNRQNGLFYTSPENSEIPGPRKTEIYDNVIPSANSQMMLVLQKMALISENDKFLKLAALAMQKIQGAMQKYPTAFSGWISATMLQQRVLKSIVVGGSESKNLLKELNANFFADILVMNNAQSLDSPLIFKSRYSDSETLAWYCSEKACHPPMKKDEIFGFLHKEKGHPKAALN
ncbi:MAG: thioredoxin domain-containing protein [Bacteroidales bacterium]|nr:thioredoxin domain-containing protein [Bacteroidales bacterium]